MKINMERTMNKGEIMLEQINSIFYDEIVPECAYGKLDIDGVNPAIAFNTNIEGNLISNPQEKEYLPCLSIKDVNTFNIYLQDYVKEAIRFYYDNDFSHDNIKSVISYLIANLTDIELSDSIKAIITRTNMLREKVEEDTVNTSFLGYDCEIEIKKLKPFLETPYSYNIKIKDKEEQYDLPSIMFAIENDTCYIYAIQNKKTSDTKLRKKLNRVFYKFNSNVQDKFDSENFNITDVTMSFMASSLVFLNYLNSIGISSINVKVNMPIRYNNHFSSNNRRLEYQKKTLSEEKYKEYETKIEKQNESYKENIVLKFMRTFYRLKEQGDVLQINGMPFAVSDSMQMTMNKEGSFTNDLCNAIYKTSEKRK